MNKIRIGTRGSALALRQTEIVEKVLSEKFPEIELERVIITTSGDKNTSKSLATIGGKGLFISEIEKELADGRIDIAVHSAKDLPSRTDKPFAIPAVLEREDPKDVYIALSEAKDSLANKAFKALQAGIYHEGNYSGLRIGTSSPRRENLIKRLLPGCEVVLLRGNVNTRLNKLRAGDCDATLLAAAGLKRLGDAVDLTGLNMLELDTDIMIPGACQGIIAIETLEGTEAEQLISQINHEPTMKLFDLQRRTMCLMNADCHDAAGVYARYTNPEEKEIKVSAFFGDSEIIHFDHDHDESDEELKKHIEKIL